MVGHKDFVEVISAQGIEDLFTNGKKLQPASHTDEILGHLKTLASAKKPVLLIEYPKTPERQALSKKLAKENGLVWLVTDRQLKTLGQSGK
jgi:endo-alpha-1,4-polygalactosaminidase (GH114 family)